MRQSQEENQRLTGSRQEQMAHCDEISQTIQEIRMGELSAQKDRDTLLAAVAGLEAVSYTHLATRPSAPPPSA